MAGRRPIFILPGRGKPKASDISDFTPQVRAVAQRTGVKLARVGDSKTNYDANVDATQVALPARSYMAWLLFWADWAFEYEVDRDDNGNQTGANFGVSGDKTGDVLARIQPIIDYDADIYIIEIATNNLVDTSATFDGVKADLDSIYTQLSAKGAEILPCVITPRSYWSGLTTAQANTARNLQNRLNSWIRGKIFSGRAQNIRVVSDPTGYWIDPTSANGDPLADKVADGLHQNDNGALYGGRALWDVLKNRITKIAVRVKSQADKYHATENLEGCLNSNPLMTGTTGMNSGTGASGSVATGMTSKRGSGSTITCVASKGTTALDGSPGTHQKLIISSNGTGVDGELWYFEENITTGFAAGDRVYTRWPAIFSANADILNSCYLDVRFEGGPGGTEYARHLNRGSGRLPYPLGDLGKGTFGHRRYKVPVGCTNIRVRVITNVKANTVGDITVFLGELATKKSIA